MFFADRTNAEPKSNLFILWEMDKHGRFSMVWDDLEDVCIVLAVFTMFGYSAISILYTVLCYKGFGIHMIGTLGRRYWSR